MLCFIGDKIQTLLKTLKPITPNKNKTLPIGTIQTVKTIFEELHLLPVLDNLKHCGHSLSSLITGLVSYKLTEDLSVVHSHSWMNNNQTLLQELQLTPFGKDALYRGLEKIGEHRHTILHHILRTLKNKYNVGLDMVFMDWTSTHFEAQPNHLIQYGYSRDHRPDRPQITIGLAQDQRSQLPVGLTIQPGNMNDQTHFKHTYDQIKPGLRKGSCLVFDAGATGNPNLDLLVSDNMRYLSRMKLNNSDVKMHLNTFNKKEWAHVVTGNKEEEVYGKKLVFPSRIKYLDLSQTLYDTIMMNRLKQLEQDYDDALSLRKVIETGRKPRKKYRNSNHFLRTYVSYMFPLKGMSRKEAIDHALQQSITGKEGFFALVSNKDFSVHEALRFYREKDRLEKMFHSMKNEINLRPTRVWKQEEIYGSILIVFLAQLVISMLRYKHVALRRVSTKFIMQSLKNFALTIIQNDNGRSNRVFSNFDGINTLIFCGKDPG
jgi:transposase